MESRRESPAENRGPFRQVQGPGVSCDHLLFRAHVAIELAEQGIAVLLGPVGQLLDEVLNLVPAGLSERLRTAEVDGVGLYQFGVELVLADDLAEAVADLRASAIPVPICVLWRKLLNWIRKRYDLLERADADSVGLAEGSVDCSAFRNPHLGPTDEGGDVGGVGIPIADEALTGSGPENCRFECPTIHSWIAECPHGQDSDASTSPPVRQA